MFNIHFCNFTFSSCKSSETLYGALKTCLTENNAKVALKRNPQGKMRKLEQKKRGRVETQILSVSAKGKQHQLFAKSEEPIQSNRYQKPN